MENIIFCGGCGSFISANEISAGKASKINNIYYCQKCSTGTQPAPARPASAPPTQRPAQTRQTMPATPTSRPQAPVQAQKPFRPGGTIPGGHARPATPAGQLISPIAGPSRVATKPAPLHQTQKVAPAKLSQTSRFRTVPHSAVKEPSSDINDANIEELGVTPHRQFGKLKTTKSGIKKIYIIGGIAAGVVIIAILVITIMSSAAKQKEEKRQKTFKEYFSEIEDAERDYPNEPQKVIDQIKKRAESLKGTNYEAKVAEKEQAAKTLIEIMDKIKELEIPVDTVEQIDKRLKDISALKNNSVVNESLGGTLKNLLTHFTKQKNKLIDEESKAREEQEAAEKKAYEEFKAKIESQRSKKEWKEMLRECDIFLGQPGGLQYQEEADKIKEEAKTALEEEQERIKIRKEWQVLNDDISKWERTGDSKSEIYVDEENKIILRNPNPSSSRGAVTDITNNNNKENWKDFTLTIEFKVLSGSLDIFLRGRTQPINIPERGVVNVFSGIPIPFPRMFKDDWQKYTIKLEGKKLTISGSGLSEPKTTDVQEGAGVIGITVKGGDNIIVKELKVKIIE